jgi:hypothetical protein
MEWHTPTDIPLFTPAYTNINRGWYGNTGFKGRGFLHNISLNCKLLQETFKSKYDSSKLTKLMGDAV